MNKTKISAEIVADSISPQGDRLTSLVLTYPRIIHAEMMTHRMFSRNASSSRAVPIQKMIEAVKNNTFCPFEFQKAHKGMQGSEYFTGQDKADCIKLWLESAELALQQAEKMKEKGITKQVINRILEPYQYYTMLITGSKEGWDNFFNLRCPQYQYTCEDSKVHHLKSKKEWRDMRGWCVDSEGHTWACPVENPKTDLDWLKLNKGQAEIHMMDLAEKIYDAVNESTPRQLHSGQWHIPFEDKICDFNITLSNEELVKISTAMVAHTSYTIVGGEAVKSYEKWIELHDKLIASEPPHSSPMEHCARAMSNEEFVSFTKSIHSISNKVEKTNQGGLRQGEVMVDDFIVNREEHYGWCNNLKGFIPYRYFIDNKTNIE